MPNLSASGENMEEEMIKLTGHGCLCLSQQFRNIGNICKKRLDKWEYNHLGQEG